MTDIRYWNRDFFAEFIDLYRSFPCVWQVKSRDYSNREKKTVAYAALVDKCREVEPDATKDSVTKKINSFRTVYRKELIKIKNSIRSGASEEEAYKPKLWYFDLLSFLNEQPNKSVSNTEDSDKEEEAEEGSEEEVTITAPDIPSIIIEERSPSVTRCESCSSPTWYPARRKRKNFNDDRTAEYIAGERLKTLPAEDEFDSYGKYIAHKLRRVKGIQHMLAQKLINDVLFEADMGALTRDFKVVKCDTEQLPIMNGHTKKR